MNKLIDVTFQIFLDFPSFISLGIISQPLFGCTEESLSIFISAINLSWGLELPKLMKLRFQHRIN